MIDLNTSPDKLRKSILQEAMQGKLTQQLPEDGDAADLLKSIKDNKNSKVKSSTEISDNEIPYRIPDNWSFSKIGIVSNLSTGFSFKKSMYTKTGTMIVRISDFNEKGIIINNPAYVQYKDNFHRFLLKNSDILMAMTGGTVGKTSPALNINHNLLLNQRVARFQTIKILSTFLHYYLNTPYIQTKIMNGKNSTNDNISMKFLKNLIIPLPPLAEQKRIVAKLDALLPKVNSFKQSVNHIQTLRSELPPRLRRSFLQEAMQGKLTQQLPEDGNAADLLQSIAEEKQCLYKTGKIKKPKQLSAITDDEIPFEIPDNWQWVKLGNLYRILEIPTISKKEYKKSGIPFYRIKDIVEISKGIKPNIEIFISEDNYLNKLKDKGNVHKSDLLITATGATLGKSIVIQNNNRMYFQGSNNIIWLYHIGNFSSEFLNYIFKSNMFYMQMHRMSSGSAIKHLSINLLSNLVIPVPPLAEQKRIVNRLDSLFSKIGKI